MNVNREAFLTDRNGGWSLKNSFLGFIPVVPGCKLLHLSKTTRIIFTPHELHLDLDIKQIISGCKGDDLYWGGVSFESVTGYPDHGFSWFHSVQPHECRDSTMKQATTTSNSSYIIILSYH